MDLIGKTDVQKVIKQNDKAQKSSPEEVLDLDMDLEIVESYDQSF